MKKVELWFAATATLMLTAGVARADNTIAVTEFMANPAGTLDNIGEYFELFNYGDTSVTMSGWTISDEGTDSFVLPDITIASGAYVILAVNPAQFIGTWGVGTDGVDVFGFDDFIIGNASDEIILSDDSANVVWSLAYPGNEPNGVHTWLAVDDFSVNSFGTSAAPGVVFDGDDNGMAGFLGYEAHTATADPFAFTATGGDMGSPLAGGYTAVPAPGALALLGVAGLIGCRRRRRLA